MRRKLTTAAVVFTTGVLATLMVGAGLGWAGIAQTFDDVPPGHPFFSEIEELADACVAEGYADGGYHPSDPVTRQAMAAFITRSFARAKQGEVVGGSPTIGHPDPATFSDPLQVATVQVNTPDLPGNCTLQVHVDSMLSVFTNGTVANTCHANDCYVYARLSSATADGPWQLATVATDRASATFAPTQVFDQADGTNITYRLEVRTYNVKSSSLTVHAGRSITASVFPVEARPSGL